MLFILASAVTGCVSISALALLVCIPVGIVGSAVWLKIYAITAGIKTYKSTIKRKKKRHDKVVLLGRAKLDTIEFLTFKDLIDSIISHDKLVSVNNELRE